MRKLLLLVLFMSPFMALKAQDGITVCHTPTIEKFNFMASDDAFLALHESPKPYKHKSEEGKMVKFTTPDGTDAQAFVLMAKEPSKNYLFVFQEWWGLNDHIKREAERLYNDLGNVNVMALDLYDGQVADNPQDARNYMMGAKRERIEAIIEGARKLAGDNARIYTIGWCFGGMWSLQASLLLKDQAAGTIIYYGMPEQDIEKLKTLKSDVLGVFAAKERSINTQVVDLFKENMQKAGRPLEVHSYDAEHGFANPSNPYHDKEASDAAYTHTLRFLRDRIN
jgi:carboxymethylenebutenolidase